MQIIPAGAIALDARPPHNVEELNRQLEKDWIAAIKCSAVLSAWK
jgi:hypothetical protein